MRVAIVVGVLLVGCGGDGFESGVSAAAEPDAGSAVPDAARDWNGIFTCAGACDAPSYTNGTCHTGCLGRFVGRCDGACVGLCDGMATTGRCYGTCYGQCAEGKATGTCDARCNGYFEGQCDGVCVR